MHQLQNARVRLEWHPRLFCRVQEPYTFKDHIGFYPTGSGIEAFRDELTQYEGSKGAVRFPLDEPLPLDLITRMVEFRVGQNRERVAIIR
jgi:uncharacterized protein YdhG (YjbR/CyaY superfamily)